MCVVPLFQPSSRDLLYDAGLCVLSRYLSPVVEICYMMQGADPEKKLTVDNLKF